MAASTRAAWASSAAASGTSFIADDRVDAAFVARFPSASRIGPDGRGYRLADDAISPEAFGARGDGVANDQAAIQQAVLFAETVGAPRVLFRHRQYSLWTPVRSSDPGDIHKYDGHALIVSGRVTLQGAAGGTTLLYLSPDGRDLQHHWQVVMGKVWRGAGIFLKGLNAVPSNSASLPSVTLIGMTLDGGCDQGQWFGYPARLSDGDGWDLTQKGLWSENNRATGDWTLIDSTVQRFRGELFYQGGPDHGAFTGRNIRMGQTNADILNPCGTNLDVDGGYFFDGFSGWEGWGGRHGRLVNCHFVHCKHMGGIQGGRCNFSSQRGGYEVPSRWEAGVDPWLDLDIVAEDCGQVAVGSWVRGRITLIDSYLYINQGIYPVISAINLDVVAIADKKTNLDSAVAISAQRTPGAQAISNVNIRLTVDATPTAVAAGRSYARAVGWGGSLGDGIVVQIVKTTARRASGPSYPAFDKAPRIIGDRPPS